MPSWTHADFDAIAGDERADRVRRGAHRWASAVAVAISSRLSAIPKKDFGQQRYFTLSCLAMRLQGSILV